jgi:hypothetical protein
MNKSKKGTSSKKDDNLIPEDMVFASTHNASLVLNRHHQIVDGACRIFFEKGYHPTTIIKYSLDSEACPGLDPGSSPE